MTNNQQEALREVVKARDELNAAITDLAFALGLTDEDNVDATVTIADIPPRAESSI